MLYRALHSYTPTSSLTMFIMQRVPKGGVRDVWDVESPQRRCQRWEPSAKGGRSIFMFIMQSLEGLGRGAKFVVYRKNKTTPVIFDIFENFIFNKIYLKVNVAQTNFHGRNSYVHKLEGTAPNPARAYSLDPLRTPRPLTFGVRLAALVVWDSEHSQIRYLFSILIPLLRWEVFR